MLGTGKTRIVQWHRRSVVVIETVALMDTAQGYQIDNFEGLTRHKGNHFFMVSDNNDLFVQRTLLLYFELVDR